MSESIKVACRVRPLNDAENSKGSKSVVTFPGDGKTSISIGGKTFTFDHVIQPNASQVEVYDTVAKPIVTSVLNGYNGTIFAYGQTSSGKTFTMEGMLGDPVYQGIIPRIVHDIFSHIYEMNENLEFHIKISYFEIYMEKIRDLLDVSKTNLSVHEDKDRVPYVKGATERFVVSPEEVFDVIDEGKANRHVAVTNMNEHSSRSHSVFMIQVRQENLESQKKLHGKLYLVDLAGSEKVAKTGAEGTVLDEAKNINKSLSCLGNVINALVENSAHVPYRDSKLTRILQESLGGNARTTMIICCSPAAFNESETKSTLLFGVRAKTIKNCVQVNEELTADEWRRRYEREKERNRRLRLVMTGLENEIKRWRNGESVNQSDWFVGDENSAGATIDEDLGASSLTLDLPPGGPPTQAARTAAAATTPGSGVNSTIEELYKQLDDKDDEINNGAQKLICLQQQVEEYEEFIKQLRADNERHQNEVAQQQAMNDASKEEVKDVLQALEELAVNYDLKAQELTAKSRELESLQEQFNSQKSTFAGKDNEIQQWKESCTSQKRRYTEMLLQLMKDLQEVGEALTDQIPHPTFTGADKIDEEFTVMRLHTNKLKSEAKSINSRQKVLEEERQKQQAAVREAQDQAKELQLRLQEFEAKVEHQAGRLDEAEASKRRLVEENDNLRAEVSKLHASVQLHAENNSRNQQILEGQTSIKTKLDEEFKRQSEQYNTQVKTLRDDLAAKEREVDELRDKNSHLSLQVEKLKTDHSKLLEDYEAKSQRLFVLEKEAARGEQAKADLKGLEDTVFKELQTLHNLRRLFVQDLQARVKKSNQLRENRQKLQQQAAAAAAAGADGQPKEESASAVAMALLEDEEEDTESGELNADGTPTHRGSLASKQKISFLENNLEQLTKVHKQLVRDNADLRCEVPKLEKRLKATMERVKTLEVSLKDAKEAAIRDRRRYQSEVDRIKEHVRQRAPGRRGPTAQIVKPIRAGHAPGTIVPGGQSTGPQPLAIIGGMNTGATTAQGNLIGH